MVLDVLSWKKEFLKRKKTSINDAEGVAQRLINIYRQLTMLSPEDNQRYNAMLLKEATPDVQIALKNIPGGEEIRDYLSFLKHTELNEGEEMEALHSGNEGLFIKNNLPKAEELSPIWASYPGPAGQPAPNKTYAPVSTASINPDAVIETVVDTFVQTQNKQRAKILDTLSQQNDDILNVLQYIVIDSDITKMQENLKEAILKVQSLQEDNLHSWEQTLSYQEETEQLKAKLQKELNSYKQTEEESEKETQKKQDAKNLDKYRKTKHPPKFSVHLVDEEN